jgi:hypothetical protein
VGGVPAVGYAHESDKDAEGGRDARGKISDAPVREIKSGMTQMEINSEPTNICRKSEFRLMRRDSRGRTPIMLGRTSAFPLDCASGFSAHGGDHTTGVGPCLVYPERGPLSPHAKGKLNVRPRAMMGYCGRRGQSGNNGNVVPCGTRWRAPGSEARRHAMPVAITEPTQW